VSLILQEYICDTIFNFNFLRVPDGVKVKYDYKLCEQFLPINLCNRSHHL